MNGELGLSIKILTGWINMDRRMVFNHYRFFISRYVTSYLSVMAVTFILDVVIDGVVCNFVSS